METGYLIAGLIVATVIYLTAVFAFSYGVAKGWYAGQVALWANMDDDRPPNKAETYFVQLSYPLYKRIQLSLRASKGRSDRKGAEELERSGDGQ